MNGVGENLIAMNTSNPSEHVNFQWRIDGVDAPEFSWGIRDIHALWNVRQGRRVNEDREASQRGACLEESDETVEGQPKSSLMLSYARCGHADPISTRSLPVR